MSTLNLVSLIPPPGLLRASGAVQGLPVSSMLKQPRQRRSREMVHAILDATILVIEGEGPESFTTNRVAEVAGISVGSLYQYFSNKEMLLAGAVERGIMDSETLMREAFAQNRLATPYELLSSTTRALIEGLSPYRRLLRHVFSVTPIAGTAGVLPMLESRLAELFRGWIEERSPIDEEVPLTPEIRVAASSGVFLLVRWLTDLQDEVPAETFIDTLAHILVAGLQPTLKAYNSTVP